MSELKWTDSKVVENLINKYFTDCDKKNRPYTMTGLAYALNCNRWTILKYKNMLFKSEKNQNDLELLRISELIEDAKNKCERYAEESLFTSKNVSGVIFNLKNNYKWVDKIENVNTNKHIIVDVDILEESPAEIEEEY